jgi:predicted HTH transcriptional regulator
LRAEILFAVEDNKQVLAIRIPPQDEPVFYYEYRPYVRDGRRSRPATPDEVKERVWAHPSSEFRREAERLKLQQMQDIVDSGRRFSAAMEDMRRR